MGLSITATTSIAGGTPGIECVGVDRPGCILYDDARQRGHSSRLVQAAVGLVVPLLACVVSRMGAALGRPDWAHRYAAADVFRVTVPAVSFPA